MITVVGSSNVDLVIQVPAIPGIGVTILGGKFQQFFGGKGANQVIAAKRAGGEAFFITKLGKDSFGEEFKEHFIKEQIHLSGLLVDDNEKTGVAQIWVSEQGENSIVVASGANMNLSIEDLFAFHDTLSESDYVLMQMEIPLNTIIYAAEYVNTNGGKVILNPAPAQYIPDELWKSIWLVTPNESEASQLTGLEIKNSDDVIKIADSILGKGVENVIITLGKKGCYWSNGIESIFFSSFKVKTVDSTAAGDVFNGALVAALDAGKNMHTSIKFATAAAALSVTKHGAQSSIPNRAEIENFLSEKNAEWI